MSKARLIITAVVLEGRSQASVARDYNVSQSWVSKLIHRYRIDGNAAFEPRSRRPNQSPNATAPSTIKLVLGLRTELTRQGLDAGADTIVWHLQHHHQLTISRATVYRIVRRAHNITPEPAKKRRSPPTSASKPNNPTKPGNPTSPTTASPPASMSRSSPGSTTTPATPCRSPPTSASPAPSCSPRSAPPATSTANPHQP